MITAWSIGDRVEMIEITLAGFRELHTGTVVGRSLTRSEYVVVWEGHEDEGEQAIPEGRLRRELRHAVS